MAVERAILKTSSLAKLLTGSERRDIRPFGYMRSEGMVYFLIPARFYFYQSLVHTYPNIFEKRGFFLYLNI